MIVIVAGKTVKGPVLVDIKNDVPKEDEGVNPPRPPRFK